MGYTVDRADLRRDKDTILDFWRQNHSRPLDRKYRWIYEANPDGEAKAWLLRDGSGECVGLAAAFPRRMRVGRDSLLAGIAGDLLVKKEHRTLGPALLLQRAMTSAVDKGEVDFIYGFPNPSAEAVMKRVGYRSLGPRGRYVSVLRSGPIERALGRRAIPLLGPLADLALGVRRVWMRRKPDAPLRYAEVKDGDHRFDELWAKTTRPFAVFAERTEAYLRWRFFHDPETENRVFAAFDAASDAPKGYLVYCWDGESIQIREMFAEDGEGVPRSLFAAFLRHVRSGRPESIIVEALASRPVAEQLQRLGFRQMRMRGAVFVYCTADAWTRFLPLQDPDGWLLMKSDQDG